MSPDGSAAQTPEDIARFKALLSSRAWRLRNLYWIIDKDGNRRLFSPNSDQQRLEDQLHHRNTVLKTRQRGITTWACIRALDLALFRANSACGIVAHTKDDALKFFRKKVLYAYDNLPKWLRDARPLTRRDMDGEIVLSNNSSVAVGVSLRSGTYQFIHVSELGPMYSKWPERAMETVSGTLNAISPDGIVTIESTAEGAAGPFYDITTRALRNDRLIQAGAATLSKMDYKSFFIGWYEDETNVLDEAVFIPPAMHDYFEKVEAAIGRKLTREQKAWYTKKSEEQGDKMWSQFPSTPEEAFKASIEGSYYGTLINKAEIQGRICKLPHIPGIPVNTFWDIGRNDTTFIWFHQQVGPWHHFIDCYEHAGEGASHYAVELGKRRDAMSYVYGKHYVPHDAEVTDWSTSGKETRAQLLEALNVKPLVVVERISNIMDGIDMVRQALPQCRFDVDKCGEFTPGSGRGGLLALRAYRKDWNDRGQCWASTPYHDWSSNGADAFRQFAQGYRTTGVQPTTPNSSSDRSRRRGRSSTVDAWRVA